MIYPYILVDEDGEQEFRRIGAWSADDAEDRIAESICREFGGDSALYTFFLLPPNQIVLRIPNEVREAGEAFFEEMGLDTASRV